MMKKIILSVLVICAFSITSSAQFYEKDSIFATMHIEQTGGQDFSLYINMTNPSKYKDYTWTRNVKGLGTDWTTAVCDPFLCHGVAVNTAKFFMDSGSSAQMIVHFYMNDMSGGGQSGTVDVILENDSTNAKDTATFGITVWNSRLNVETPNKDVFKVYPNPSSEIINIKADESLRSIEVLDLTGKVLVTKNLKDNETKVELKTDFIPTGLYLVRVKTNSGHVSTRKVSVNK